MRQTTAAALVIVVPVVVLLRMPGSNNDHRGAVLGGATRRVFGEATHMRGGFLVPPLALFRRASAESSAARGESDKEDPSRSGSAADLGH